MATIEKRVTSDGKTTFRVKVRLRGHPTQTASFASLTKAREWVQNTESAIRSGRYFPTVEAKRHTLKDLIEKYRSEELPKLRSSNARRVHLDWWEQQLGAYALVDIRPSLIKAKLKLLAAKTTRYGEPLSNSTINRYSSTLSHVFSVAMREWEWVDDNPFRKIKPKDEPEGVVRFLSDEERESLLTECKNHNQDLYTIIVLALSTGARRNELLSLSWDAVDLKSGLITFHKTKNGHKRTVPVTGHALELIKAIASERRFNTEYIFQSPRTGKPLAIENVFKAALGRAGIENFRFHDLRHSAASYMVMAGVDMRTVAEILGHRDLKVTHRYAHLSRKHVSDAVEKLDGAIFGKLGA